MSWICPLCSTANVDAERRCIVCDTEKPARDPEATALLDRLKKLRDKKTGKGSNADFEQGMEAFHRRDHATACGFFLRAAEAGYAPAQNMAGECYYYGRGVLPDIDRAVEWYRKAAQQENAQAQYNLGYCYFYGKGVAANAKEAAQWFRLAADQGHAGAMNQLAECY